MGVKVIVSLVAAGVIAVGGVVGGAKWHKKKMDDKKGEQVRKDLEKPFFNSESSK